MKASVVVVVALGCALVGGCKKKGGSGGETQDSPPPVDNTPVEHADISSRPPKGCGSAFYEVHYGDAYKTLREAEGYKASERKYYVRELSDRRNEYLEAAISPKFREGWYGTGKSAEKTRQCMGPLFDAINNAAKKTLPKYQPRGYTQHDDDSLIKDTVKEKFPDAKFLDVGVSSKTWEIEKLRNGIPRVRFKYGMAWIKTASTDDGYCRIVFVNVQQDYSGGGTFGESKGNYIKAEPAGCK